MYIALALRQDRIGWQDSGRPGVEYHHPMIQVTEGPAGQLGPLPGTSIDTVTVVSPTGASTHTSYIPFLRQRGEASTGGCLGTSMASNGLNIAEFRGLVY